jgi:hypothetical protein
MCFCVIERRNEQNKNKKNHHQFCYIKNNVLLLSWKRKNKNELEKSVTPPYVALLFAKSRKRLLLCTTSTTKISKNHLLSSGKKNMKHCCTKHK